MYKVKVIKNQYVGTLVKTMSTGKDGYKAVFTIKPGDIVDFLAFKSKSVALNSKNKKHTFTVPPHKNFGKEDGVAGLCYTAGIDTTKKLTNSKTGKDMCTTGENGYIQAYYEVTK